MSLNLSNAGAGDAVDTRQVIGDLDSLSVLTLSAWVRLTSLEDYQHVMNKGSSTGTQWGMQASGPAEEGSNDVTVNAKDGGTESTQYGVTTGNILSADGLFHHWCMVYDGGNFGNSNRLKFYYDGVEQSLSYSGTIPSSLAADVPNALYLGFAEWDPGFEFNGTLDDVRVYNRALSDAEIQTLWACRGHDGIYGNLLRQYPLNDYPPGDEPVWPVIESVTETSFSGNSSNHQVDMPATTESGELLIMHIAVESGSLSGSTPSGWFELWATSIGSLNYAAYFRYADGTEGGTTVNVVSGSPGNGAAQVYRISGTNLTIVYVSAVTGSGANPNPPSLSHTEMENAMWLVFAGAANDDESFISAPSGFGNLVNTLSGGGFNSSASVGSARQYDADMSKNPSSFTLTSTESWASAIMLVQAKGSIRQTRGPFYTDAVPINTPAYDGDALSKRRRFT